MTEWLERLRAHGALLEGHFLLSSGLHSPHYVQCARFLQHPAEAAAAGAALADALAGSLGAPPDVVVSPAIGGIVLGHEVGRALDRRAVWAERSEGAREAALAFRRGFVMVPGESFVAVEDVVTTAGSLRELITVAEAAGGRLAGVATLVDRSGGKVEWSVPSVALVTIDGVQHPPESCPLCAEGAPLLKPGSRPDRD
ncbi:MAG: orotate phosphoribosyltransferase [Gemmatimonadetes bacterium]|nr:orotate phosphoribosyltransferase [Gemmatimonadota bacterium]